MQTLLLVAVFGVVGVLCRYGADLYFAEWNVQFPLSTFLINFFGSLLAGTLYVLSSTKDFSSVLQTALLVGFCGGFTTFSAYALQTIMMLERGRLMPALVYFAVSPLVGLLGAALPVLVMRRWM